MKKVDEGIFLFRTSYSETSLIATFYSKESGIKKFIFKGGKKKSHNLFPLAISELTFYERKESDLSNLTNADPISRQDIQFDAIRSTIAFFMAEVIRKSVDTHEKDEALYNYLVQTIQSLDKSSELSLFPIQFLVDLSIQLGVQPLIEGNNPVLNFKEGTIGVGEPVGQDKEGGNHIQLLMDIFNKKESLTYPKDTRMNALKAMVKYYGYHVPRMEQLDTLEIVQEILS